MAMDAEMQERGLKSTFRATGQTGILITGSGVPLDAVIADFMAGSVEYLTPDNDEDHWDILSALLLNLSQLLIRIFMKSQMD